jgi:hypothetical protein
MALVADWQKIDDGRLVKNYIDGFTTFLNNMDTMLANVKAMATKYPSDATEVDGYISAAKTAIQAVLNKY